MHKPLAAPPPRVVKQAMRSETRHALWAFSVWLGYTGLVALANLFAAQAAGDEASPWMAASGITLGFLAIPLFSIALPLWLGRRWGLVWSWWPEAGGWRGALALWLAYLLVTSFEGARALMAQGLGLVPFAGHFASAALFHVTYYPLFAILLLGAWRKAFGLRRAVLATALAFAAYHLAQFTFFPEGTRPAFLLMLFAAFAVNLTLYLLSRALMLAALAHCFIGAIGLARAGTLFEAEGFVFWVGLVLLAALFGLALLWPRHGGAAGAWLRLGAAD